MGDGAVILTLKDTSILDEQGRLREGVTSFRALFSYSNTLVEGFFHVSNAIGHAMHSKLFLYVDIGIGVGIDSAVGTMRDHMVRLTLIAVSGFMSVTNTMYAFCL